VGLHGQQYWRARFAQDRRCLEERRKQAMAQALGAAWRFRDRWDDLQRMWVFGSVLGPGFRDHSDLDLLVQGLPPTALLEALALAEAEGPLTVDLKRVEDLGPDLRRRLLAHARPLPLSRREGAGDDGA
jgi:predicted nucleotidyltransferase